MGSKHTKQRHRSTEDAHPLTLADLPLHICKCGVRFRYRDVGDRCPLCGRGVIEAKIVQSKESAERVLNQSLDARARFEQLFTASR